MKWSRGISIALAWLAAASGCALGATMPNHDVPDWTYRAWQTDDGLLRFNGKDFTAVALPALPKVPSRVIRVKFLDRRGRIWLGIERGPLVCVEPGAGRTYGEAEGIIDSRILSITEDREGVIWLSRSNIISRIKDGRGSRIGVAEGFPQNGGDPQVTCDSEGDMWFSCASQVGQVIDGRPLIRWSFDARPIRMCAAGTDGFWVAAGPRLLRVKNGREPVEVGCLSGRTTARTLFEDRSGALWIGTASEGLYRLKDGVLESVPTSHQEVDCVTEEREGNLWAGTNGVVSIGSSPVPSV